MNLLFKYNKIILLVFVVIFAALLTNLNNFQLDASSDSLVLENDADLLYYQNLRKNYPSDEGLIISYQVRGDLLGAENLQNLTNFSQKLSKITEIKSITSILTVPLFASPRLSLMDLASNSVSINKGNADLSLAKNEFQTSPIYSDNLVGKDGKTTAILVDISPKNSKQVIAKIREIINNNDFNATIFLGGLPLITNDIVEYIGNDLVIFSLIVVLVMATILLIIFKNLRFMLLPLSTALITAFSMTALLGLLGWKVTVISSNFFSLLLVMTLSVMIHLIVKYLELAGNSSASKSELISQSVKQMFKPCFYTTLTTLIAFVSLMISGIRPVIDFGYMMAIGVILALVLSFLLFPLMMSLLPIAKATKLKQNFKLTTIFADFTAKFYKKIIFFSAILLVVITYFAQTITVENRFIDYFKSNTEIHQGLSMIDENLGGTIPLEIIFSEIGEDYFYDASIRDKALEVHNYLNSRPELGKVLSIDTLMQVLAGANDGVRPSGFFLNIIKSQVPDYAKKYVFTPYINEDSGELRFVARVKENYPNLKRKALIQSIENDLIKMGFAKDSFRISGVMVLYNNMLQSLFDSQIKTISAVFLMIWLMFLILFRSFSVATLALIPNILPSILILGIMGFFKIPLDLMTITIAAIAIGIGVDNAIHYISRYKIEFSKTQNYTQSMFNAHQSIGVAMFYTSITVALGFMVLVFSNFIPSLYFGIFTAIAMLSAVILNLTLLPALFMAFKPKL